MRIITHILYNIQKMDTYMFGICILRKLLLNNSSKNVRKKLFKKGYLFMRKIPINIKIYFYLIF